MKEYSNEDDTNSKRKDIVNNIKTSRNFTLNNNLENIRKKLDEEKDNIKINDNLEYSLFEKECINKILNFYELACNNDSDEKEKINKFLIKPYFNNELIDENYIYNIRSDLDKAKNSLIFTKNTFNTKELTVKNIFGKMFGANFALCIIDCMKGEDDNNNQYNNNQYNYNEYNINQYNDNQYNINNQNNIIQDNNNNKYNDNQYNNNIQYNKNLKLSKEDSPLKYQNYWINGLKLIIYELIFLLLLLGIFPLSLNFSNEKKISNNTSSNSSNSSNTFSLTEDNLNSFINNSFTNINNELTNINDELTYINNSTKQWDNFLSNEYKCLSLDIVDLLSENYSFNITCEEDKQFFYISKFGVSPYNEENENIAECFSSSFKNLIVVDPDCDLSNYLDEQLKEYKYKEVNINVNVNEMNISKTILNNCNNKNQRTKFFLSYSCYIPYAKAFGKHLKRDKIIRPYLICETILFILLYSIFLNYRHKFFNKLKNNEYQYIKNVTLMIDSISIEKGKILFALNQILLEIKNILSKNEIVPNISKNYSFIKEINYSILNSEEKELYDKFNLLLKKRDYLDYLIKKEGENGALPRNFIFMILSKICKCFKKTHKQEYDKNEKELKKIFINIIKRKDNNEKIKKIYITFSSYEIKQKLKNKKISIENKLYTLKKSDLYPHDINWENLNIDKRTKICRRVCSYFLLIIFIFALFIIIFIISILQNTFERRFNLSTDCSNVHYKNNTNEIYLEFIDKNKTEKEKIYTYCYCQSDLNGNKIFNNNLNFDPCENYNKYKYYKKAIIISFSIFISVINLYVDKIVEKIISIQKFESKSYQNNLNIITSIIILLFSNLILVILINTRFKIKEIPFFIFGKYEDITPEWVRSIPTIILNDMGISGIMFIFKITFKNIFHRCKFGLFFLKNPIIHFYDFIKIYAPECEYTEYTCFIIFFFSSLSILKLFPLCYFVVFLLIIIYSIYYFKNSIQSYIFFLNKQYFIMFFVFIYLIIIAYIVGDFWWFSSEYFFIDIHENVYNDFFGSNKQLIDKFIKGNANISEKILAKLLLKRNICFIIQLGFLIIIEILYFSFCKTKKNNDYIKNESLLEMNDYMNIKYYEIYRLLYYKINTIKLSNYNYKHNHNELSRFINNKYSEYKKYILNNDVKNEKYHKNILDLKNNLIKEKKITFKNPDYTYSPFLLDDYCIASISKLVLSPY